MYIVNTVPKTTASLCPLPHPAETLYDEKGEPLKVLQRWNKNKPQYYFDNLAREEEEKKGKGKEKGQRRS